MKTFLKKVAKIIAAIAGLFALFWLYIIFLAPEPVFGPEQDVELGKQVVQSIAEQGSEGPVLSREDYPEAYEHMDRIVAELVKSPHIEYADLFKYNEVRIIHNDKVLNAFCTPGGYIYVYSGIIHYLDAEDHLAGVLGHEIAHAEQRHSSLRMQKQFGTERLQELVILTTPISARDAWAVSMLTDLTSLKFGREQEAESDRLSVHYLDNTDYACDSAAGFFEKLTAGDGHEEPPAFLSDHPSSESRVQDIRKEAAKLGCKTSLGDQSRWHSFQASLPPVVEETPDEEMTEAVVVE